jgi:hypothetical protein
LRTLGRVSARPGVVVFTGLVGNKLWADPTFVQVPTAELIAKAYAERRRKLIDPHKALTKVEAGDPKLGQSETIYLCVVDNDRNCVSLIQSNYIGFGSGLVPGELGFALQNRGTLLALDAGHPNCLQPHKRPFHTIIPSFVMKEGHPWLVFGVMGGDMQPQCQVEVLCNLIDFGMNVQEAGEAPRIEHLGSATPTGLPAQEDGGTIPAEQPGLTRSESDSFLRQGKGCLRIAAVLRFVTSPHAASLGAARQGPSLLGGLLVCGRCGRRLLVNYHNAGRTLRYSCTRGVADYAEPVCQSLSGHRLDRWVGQQVLAVLEPAALELHLAAAADLEQERQRLHQHWHQQLELARYELERADRQYQAVEPENRLVARELERRWEKALHDQRRLQEDYERFCQQQPPTLSAAEREQIRALAGAVPELWDADTTTPADPQRIVRFLIERIVLTVQGNSERLTVTIHWTGGCSSTHELARPVQRYDQMAQYPCLRRRVQELRAQGLSMGQVAQCLDQEAFQPPKRALRFTSAMVADFLARHSRAIRSK